MQSLNRPADSACVPMLPSRHSCLGPVRLCLAHMDYVPARDHFQQRPEIHPSGKCYHFPVAEDQLGPGLPRTPPASYLSSRPANTTLAQPVPGYKRARENCRNMQVCNACLLHGWPGKGLLLWPHPAGRHYFGCHRPAFPGTLVRRSGSSPCLARPGNTGHDRALESGRFIPWALPSGLEAQLMQVGGSP